MTDWLKVKKLDVNKYTNVTEDCSTGYYYFTHPNVYELKMQSN